MLVVSLSRLNVETVLLVSSPTGSQILVGPL
jgi:hypothetical protein